MREYAKVGPKFWTDHWGQEWLVSTSRRRLKFRIPCHAALRRHVFHQDAYACRRCGARASGIPDGYDGSETLFTTTTTSSGWPDMLVLDHILTLKAGGLNVISNLQTLCETCNRRKQGEDIKAIGLYRETAR